MSYTITCPYCFGTMQDDEVLFRSEKVNHDIGDILPEGYDDIEDFKARYRGEDKESILIRYRDWEFFAERPDRAYEKFWADFNGTTEYNPADIKLGVLAHHRRVIDPSRPEDQGYLKRQSDGSYFIREDGMVTRIELVTGEKCRRRVCCHCHNPLPQNYGKTGVKFVTVIGITAAGKTVYLSQLLKDMGKYVAKVGLAANGKVMGTGVQNFLEANVVKSGQPLPSPTPFVRLQQPMFYQLSQDLGGDLKHEECLVLYDVAGEVFSSPEEVTKFAPFVEHADGVLMIIDPLQFEAIRDVANVGDTEKKHQDPATALEVIQNIISHGNVTKKCQTPFAICMSKIDTDEVQAVLSDNLRRMLIDDVASDIGRDGENRPLFNAKGYNPILEELTLFMKEKSGELVNQLRGNYSLYSYFAFTSIGCPTEIKLQDTGEELKVPVGPILPKRIEEPLLWLLHVFGYIGTNAPIPYPGKKFVRCPKCESIDTQDCDILVRLGILRTERHNRKCNNCNFTWINTAQ